MPNKLLKSIAEEKIAIRNETVCQIKANLIADTKNYKQRDTDS